MGIALAKRLDKLWKIQRGGKVGEQEEKKKYGENGTGKGGGGKGGERRGGPGDGGGGVWEEGDSSV